MPTTTIERGTIPVDQVAPDSLVGIPRQQTNAARWNGDGWDAYVADLKRRGVEVREGRFDRARFATDAGGLAQGLPHGVLRPRSAREIAEALAAAQEHRVPVTVRGGGLTTEGESVAYGGLLVDMSAMNRVLRVDRDGLTARVEAGIFWHQFGEVLRRDGLDYCSAPLNLTSSVGGTLGVGGIDINSPRLGCSADQALALQVVTPTGEIRECSEREDPELFERVLLGYGQFGVITEATLRIRPFTPIRMRYCFYSSLRAAIEDMQLLVREDAADYIGILTMMDSAINLLVAFDSDEREREFDRRWARRLRGHGQVGFALRLGARYAARPWKWGEALYLLRRRLRVFPEFTRPEYASNGRITDRATMFSRAVWKHWGGRQMVIPDLAASTDKFVEAVERGNAVCRRFFPHYALYCVGIKLFGPKPRYELSCMPADAEGFAFGCEFEPLVADDGYRWSRDHIQSFKNAIYDIGVDMGLSYYRFGGMMKGYIRRAFPAEVVDRHLAMKRAADPAMILNADVVF